MRYRQISVVTSSMSSDIVSLIMSEDSIDNGVAIHDNADIQEVIGSGKCDYVDTSLLAPPSDVVVVVGVYDLRYDVASLEARLEQFRAASELQTGSLELTSTVIDSASWENEWKKYYVPIEFNQVAVVPSTCVYTGDCPYRLVLEPGLAFGTGRHETTAMCIRLMQEHNLHNKKVLDLGCGSGILGICAITLGCQSCDFVDVDTQAIESTQANLALNKISKCSLSRQIVGDNYDIILANMTVDILGQMLDNIYNKVSNNGLVITSGIINERAAVHTDLYSSKFTMVKTLLDGEWSAFVWKKTV